MVAQEDTSATTPYPAYDPTLWNIVFLLTANLLILCCGVVAVNDCPFRVTLAVIPAVLVVIFICVNLVASFRSDLPYMLLYVIQLGLSASA